MITTLPIAEPRVTWKNCCRAKKAAAASIVKQKVASTFAGFSPTAKCITDSMITTCPSESTRAELSEPHAIRKPLTEVINARVCNGRSSSQVIRAPTHRASEMKNGANPSPQESASQT